MRVRISKAATATVIEDHVFEVWPTGGSQQAALSNLCLYSELENDAL